MLYRALIVSCLLAPAAAEAQSPQFLTLNDTLEVEVHGLRTWTAERLNDTLGRISPGLSLPHACAAVMRRFLGFADAEVAYHPAPGGGFTRIVVTAIEPGDSARVRHLPSPAAARPLVERWHEVVSTLRTEFQAMFPLQVPRFLRGESDSIGTRVPQLASAGARRLRGEIQRLSTPADLEDAIAVLETDSTSWHRIAAIWVLTNFPSEPRAWGALLTAARTQRPMGYETWALNAMAPPWGDGSVDLRPHEETLAAILGGTGLMQIIPTMRLLGSVSLEPAMARRLARAGRDLLLSNLQSREASRRDAVRTFLERASGRRYGDDVEAWRRWLDS